MAFNQPATFNEEWSDERVKSYLNRKAPHGENEDFNALYVAYKHMRAIDFARFLIFFKADGRDVNAVNTQGKSFLAVITKHAQSEDFVKILSC